MVKCKNIINRLGNKENDIKHFKDLLPLNVKTVIEPFGGSFAVIKHFYKDTNKYKFHINDKDERLHYVYLHPEELMDTLKKLDTLYINEYKDTEYSKENKFINYVKDYDIDDMLKGYILEARFIRGSMFKHTKYNNYNPIELNVLKNALISKLDYSEIFEQYKNDEDAFLFLDPPYLFSDNSGYSPQESETDMTKIIVDILEYLTICKCKVMLIINKLYILTYLFRNYIKREYIRIYQLSKKKSGHLIICNYNI